jgi:hypothetical protein
MMLVGWHEQQQVVFFFGPDARPHAGFRVSDLQAIGWHCDAAALRKVLPRIDESPLARV